MLIKTGRGGLGSAGVNMRAVDIAVVAVECATVEGTVMVVADVSCGGILVVETAMGWTAAVVKGVKVVVGGVAELALDGTKEPWVRALGALTCVEICLLKAISRLSCA